MRIRLACLLASLVPSLAAGCGSSSNVPQLESHPVPAPGPSCAASSTGGSTTIAAPVLEAELAGQGEGWLGSPAVADLDGDGTPEIVLGRAGHVYAWRTVGGLAFEADVDGRVWASPVVADFVPGEDGLETAIAARDVVHLYSAAGDEMPGFPVSWRDELRSIAAGDVDGDGALEIVVATTSRLEQNDRRDLVMAFEANGDAVAGFPPNTSGSAECDDACYVTGGYDQNLALGDVDDDGVADIFAPHDNAYMSLHDGTGFAFDAAPIFEDRTKFSGVRFLLDYALAQQGYADDEDTALQAHFTNSAPAIADLDGDGRNDLVVLGSVQNASQEDRLRGVVIFALHEDGTRLTDWIEPYYEPAYVAGLWDFEGTNIVGATNQVSVADIFADGAHEGPELVFAGFDGRIHCVDARSEEIWNYVYTNRTDVLTAGVVVADLSGDGAPEVVFASYSTRDDAGELFALDGGGNEVFRVTLPGRGAMAAPTVANVDADDALEIVVPLKDEDGGAVVRVYEVPGSDDNCLPWPTGRANLRRDGFAP